MRFKTLFSGALVATTAVNILLASAAHAGIPNGWKQVGSECTKGAEQLQANSMWGRDKYKKLQKKSDSSKYGVYRNGKSWQGNTKGISLSAVNKKMHELCGVNWRGSLD